MERGLVLRQHFFGADSDEVWRACTTVGELCNLLAMTYLQQEDFPMVLELLKKAEILTERDERGRAVTFNNLACYYRRQGKLHAALTYLQKAIRIEQRLENVENRADTHLNLCAVLSQLGRHAGALEYAQSSLILLQEELFSGNMMQGVKQGEAGTKADRIAVLAIAYHNIGVEQEFLHKYEQSIQSYRKGVEISETYLGQNHGITITLRNSFLAARRAVANKTNNKAALREHSKRGRRSGKKKKNGAIGRAYGSSTRSSRSPSRKDEERWRDISEAYGNIPGVTPVQASPSNMSTTLRDGGGSATSPTPALNSVPALGQNPETQDNVEKHTDLITPRDVVADENGTEVSPVPTTDEVAKSPSEEKASDDYGALDMLDKNKNEESKAEENEGKQAEPEPSEEKSAEPEVEDSGARDKEQKAEELFHLMDKNENGEVDKREFMNALRKNDKVLTFLRQESVLTGLLKPRTFEAAFGAVDTDSSESLSLKEFKTAILQTDTHDKPYTEEKKSED